MTDEAMSPLRRRVIEDMTIRKFNTAQFDQNDLSSNRIGLYRCARSFGHRLHQPDPDGAESSLTVSTFSEEDHFVELHEKATTAVSKEFLLRLIAAIPYTIHTVPTDNGIQFTTPGGGDQLFL